MTSEKKVNSSTFKAKLGTMDKKNPQSMYLFASTYLSPTREKDDYRSDIISLEKELKLNTKTLLKNDNLINSEFLLITEVPIARLSPSRKVHFMIQFYFKPSDKNRILNKSFNDISDAFSVSCSNICENFKNIIQKHGFTCSKSKSTNYL